MQLSRLLLDPSDGDPPLEVRFDPDIALVSAAGSDAGRVRSALESLFRGSTDFGRAYLRIDRMEVDVTPELAAHLAHHIGPRGRILDTGFAVHRQGDAGPGGMAGSTVLRAAVEMLEDTDGRLDLAAVNGALQAVLADRRSLQTEAETAVARATELRAVAQAGLDGIEARVAARGETDDHAAEAAARHRHDIGAADKALAAAVALRDALVDGSSRHPRSDLLTVQEFVLRLRLRRFAAAGALPEADHRSLHNALGVLLDLQHGVRNAAGPQLLDQAVAALVRLESERLRTELRREVTAHAQSLPAVGTMPLVLDAPFGDVEPAAADQALSSLDSSVGLVQMVVLRPDPPLTRWASLHRRHPESAARAARPQAHQAPTVDRRASMERHASVERRRPPRSGRRS